MPEFDPNPPIEPNNIEYNPEQGYIAAVLDDESRKRIREMAIYPNIQCHHVTMAYKTESQEIWNHFTSMIGQEISIPITGIVSDDRGQALIANVDSEKTYPHITMSCTEGVKATYSNELIENSIKNNNVTPFEDNFELKAIVTFIPFYKK